MVAYDGSKEGRAAVHAAATLFGGRTVLVVSVWEAGLALAMAPPDVGFASYGPTIEESEVLDRLQSEHAAQVAQEGAMLAEEAGAGAEKIPVVDVADVATTIAAVADERDAAAIVVGSRGHKGLGSKLFGTTSRRLLDDSRRPVMVVRGDKMTMRRLPIACIAALSLASRAAAGTSPPTATTVPRSRLRRGAQERRHPRGRARRARDPARRRPDGGRQPRRVREERVRPRRRSSTGARVAASAPSAATVATVTAGVSAVQQAFDRTRRLARIQMLIQRPLRGRQGGV